MENKYYNENYYNANTVLKFLRKVLNEINKSYVDSGMRTAFLMKRYIEKYKIDQEHCHEHVLLCMLKDIGLFYMDGAVPSNDPALAAASSYAFLHQCSPLDANARPLLFYKAKYMEDVNNPDYDMGLLMTLLYQVSLYIYQRKDVEEIEEILREDRKRKIYNPDQVKKVIKLLKDSPDIIEKLNSESELYVYETSRYISLANYGTDTLGEFLDTTSFMFEFHNHETMAHTVTTAQIAYDLAIACKLTESTSRAIEIAGKVHDIGKIRVPLEILCFPGKLEGEALAEMQNHAKYTKEIIEGCFSYVIVEIASRHHEKLDGSGYPLGITKKDLTSADKVLAVADICSALYCKRSYKAAFTPEKIQSILLSDAKAGKLDERIVNHLIDDYDRIMANAKAVEDIALKKYETMKDEYEALAKSPALRHVFGESEDLDSERPESIAADETEEYISDVIKYDMKKDSEEVTEQIIYVDENGNEIDYNPEEDELYSDDPEEALFGIEEEKKLDPLEEYNQAEMGDVPIEEIKTDDDLDEEEEEPSEEMPVFDLNEKEEEPAEAIEEATLEEEEAQQEEPSIDDEFDAFLNSIPEVEEDPFKDAPKKKPFVPKAPLKHPHVDFDPFKEDIDPVFEEPILPKEETKEDIDLEFDAFLNSIPEVKEDPFKEEETVEDNQDVSLDLEDEEESEEPMENEESFEEEENTSIELKYEGPEEDIDSATEEAIEIEELEATEESSEELEEEETEVSDNDPFEDEEEIDDSLEESPNDAINSKYEETDEEIDSAIEEDEEEETEEEKEDDYVTSYVDEEDIDLIEDENPSDSIIPDESKYDVDPDEEIDSSTDESIETEETEVPESKEEKEDDYVTSYVDEDEFEEEAEAPQEEEKPEEALESKEDDYVTSYVDEDEFEEENESKDEPKEAIEEEKEDDYVTSYVDEDEFEEESKEPEGKSKEDDYVTSYVDEDEFEEENNAPQVESKEPEPKIESKSDDESDEDEDEDDDDEDEDDDEDDSIEEDEEEEEDKDPKHKKFFSNDIYRKMFTYNPNKKKK